VKMVVDRYRHAARQALVTGFLDLSTITITSFLRVSTLITLNDLELPK